MAAFAYDNCNCTYTINSTMATGSVTICNVTHVDSTFPSSWRRYERYEERQQEEKEVKQIKIPYVPPSFRVAFYKRATYVMKPRLKKVFLAHSRNTLSTQQRRRQKLKTWKQSLQS